MAHRNNVPSSRLVADHHQCKGNEEGEEQFGEVRPCFFCFSTAHLSHGSTTSKFPNLKFGERFAIEDDNEKGL
ncbi:hypothetical protein HPP92_004618 [Vanilla planifolia]|uniref:Uncharacterized protein n=1 Tax=Vanilla planifolia TaxID=51239 RepID=A0A835VIA6_VANPL|nr:hypothetical protein HPP92_004618 [Vanilla planifolia]